MPSRVADKISADHPPSRGSSFDSSTIERRRIGDHAIAISGRGKVKTAKAPIAPSLTAACTTSAAAS